MGPTLGLYSYSSQYVSDLSTPHNGPSQPKSRQWTAYPCYGGTRQVPEWAFPEQKCSPFAVDVWCPAYLVRGLFTEGFELDLPHKIDGFEFLHQLLVDMSDEDPAKRPAMDEVVNRFTKIKSGFSEWKLRLGQEAFHAATVLYTERIPVIPSLRSSCFIKFSIQYFHFRSLLPDP